MTFLYSSRISVVCHRSLRNGYSLAQVIWLPKFYIMVSDSLADQFEFSHVRESAKTPFPAFEPQLETPCRLLATQRRQGSER